MHAPVTYDCGISHGPLRGSADAVVKAAFIRVIASVRIREEQGVNATSVEQLC